MEQLPKRQGNSSSSCLKNVYQVQGFLNIAVSMKKEIFGIISTQVFLPVPRM